MKKTSHPIGNLLLMLASLLLTMVIIGCVAYLYLDSQLPDVQALKDVRLPIPLRVYTSDGQLIAEFGELRSNPVTINEVPPLLIKAILATEDQRFYQHSGIDVFGLMRATTQLILTGTKSQGGSTITMQVARNFYLTRKKTFVRKLTEIMLALKIEREFTKDQILTLYLNKIYLGNRAYGVAAAAQVYYGKPLNELSLPELAMIAGLPKAPSTINPIANPAAAKDRRDHVLTRMYDLGYIDQKAYINAIKSPLNASYHGQAIPVRAPYVAEMVRDMMVTSFGEDAYTRGYNVYTTINSQDQLAANQALRTSLLAYDKRHGYRGPERNLGVPTTKDNKWLAILGSIPSVNGLKPAAIVSISNDAITAVLSDGSLITIPWKGLEWARPALPDGKMGETPDKASDIVKIGDVIRIEKNSDGSWQLSEIPNVEGAFVALDPQNGAILALVGGFDFNQSKFNRVVQADRQPGSGFKPFIYAAALAKGYTLASVFNDAPIVFEIPGQDTLWRPQNDDHTFRGPTTLRNALARSVNVISVRLLQAIDVPYALKYMARFGFDPHKLPRNLSLALGTGEVTPLELVRGYAVFANGGYRIMPYFIDHITDNTGKITYQADPKIACEACITRSDNNTMPMANPGQYAQQVIPPQIAFLMTSALQQVIRTGTATAAQVLNRSDIAGKTGTTSDWVDSWFTGFNSDIVATAWVGFDAPASIHEFGAQAALPMWIEFMKVALADKPEHTMAEPSNIVEERVDPNTGSLNSGGVNEYFRGDALPQDAPTPPPDGSSLAPPSGGENGNGATNNGEPLF